MKGLTGVTVLECRDVGNLNLAVLCITVFCGVSAALLFLGVVSVCKIISCPAQIGTSHGWGLWMFPNNR